jgi:hypothetical protein
MNRTKSSPGMERLVAVAAGLALIAAACGGGNADMLADAGHGSPPALAMATELATLRLAAARPH